jgi:hypothetical protein
VVFTIGVVGQRFGIERLDEVVESHTRGSESLVVESLTILAESRVARQILRVNPREPSRKAKYSCVTDSEPVPRGKGEKNPDKGSEIERETVSLQAMEGRFNV